MFIPCKATIGQGIAGKQRIFGLKQGKASPHCVVQDGPTSHSAHRCRRDLHRGASRLGLQNDRLNVVHHHVGKPAGNVASPPGVLIQGQERAKGTMSVVPGDIGVRGTFGQVRVGLPSRELMIERGGTLCVFHDQLVPDELPLTKGFPHALRSCPQMWDDALLSCDISDVSTDTYKNKLEGGSTPVGRATQQESNRGPGRMQQAAHASERACDVARRE